MKCPVALVDHDCSVVRHVVIRPSVVHDHKSINFRFGTAADNNTTIGHYIGSRKRDADDMDNIDMMAGKVRMVATHSRGDYDRAHAEEEAVHHGDVARVNQPKRRVVQIHSENPH